jgi:hypothetical protein
MMEGRSCPFEGMAVGLDCRDSIIGKLGLGDGYEQRG